MPQYNGDNDPYDYLDAYNVQMDLQATISLVKCRIFSAILGGIPWAWFKSLPPRSINSWEGCQQRFLNQYRALRRQLAPPCHLATVFQKANEPLRDYIARFRREMSNVEDPSDESILTTISAGLRKDGKLYERIYRTPIKDLGEFYERASNEIRWEDAFGSKKPVGSREEAGGSNQNKRRHNGDAGREAWGEHSKNEVFKRAQKAEGDE
ncbi:uncharacterized protein LOC127790965 [Diospyros lotus]|uniref:uncharacterized protein LOC127790965 n=1 Tax=Diospyros lotus TaxID=55363 RepID=UPI00225B9B33|nr:uncharacterized protein LOC127790965 [Diospyros lotus]